MSTGDNIIVSSYAMSAVPAAVDMCRSLLVTGGITLIICSAAFIKDTGMTFEVGRGGEWGHTPQIPYKCALYIMTLSPAKHPIMKLHISDPVKVSKSAIPFLKNG